MACLKFFGRFRSYVATREVSVAAATVRQALDQLLPGNRDLQASMMDNGTLRAYVRILVNGHDIELAQGLDTPLGPDDEVAIFSPAAGGHD